MDRISSLPDELIRLIVLHLSVKDAASVLVLSRRYRNFVTVFQDLEFDDNVEFEGSFTDLVSRELAVLNRETRVRRFSLKSRSRLHIDRINGWLVDVLNRCVMDIEMCIYKDNGYKLPVEIFRSKTLTKLEIGEELVINCIPRTAFLPALQTLTFVSVQFCTPQDDDCVFNSFLLACPVLKELYINGMYWETWKWSGTISSQSLQRLKIIRELSRGFNGPEPQIIKIDTPSLVYLEMADYVPDGYTIVNFDSLVEAKLILLVMVDRQWHAKFASDGDILSSNATNLIQGIRNVEFLHLFPYSFDMFYFFRDAIPVFEKLHSLTMEHDDAGFCWRFLPFLLEKTPNLKNLLIEGGMHVSDLEEHDYVCDCVLGYSCLLSCRIEVLEITLWYGGETDELQQVKHFLGKLPCLQLLKVNVSRGYESEKRRIGKYLQKLPRASSRCRIELIWFS